MDEQAPLLEAARALAARTVAAIAKKDLDAALGLVVGLAVDAGLCDEASITHRRSSGTLETAAPTSDLVVTADRLQYELGEGPCVQAVFDEDLQVAFEVATDARWPRWGPAAADLGIAGVVSAHLYDDGHAAGSLNLYSRWTRSYHQQDRELIRLIAAHASIALAHFRGKEHLWKAIDSRHTIGMAQGILMHKYQINPETAFALMRRLSEANNSKLPDVAVHVVRTQTLPEPPTPPGNAPAQSSESR